MIEMEVIVVPRVAWAQDYAKDIFSLGKSAYKLAEEARVVSAPCASALPVSQYADDEWSSMEPSRTAGASRCWAELERTDVDRIAEAVFAQLG